MCCIYVCMYIKIIRKLCDLKFCNKDALALLILDTFYDTYHPNTDTWQIKLFVCLYQFTCVYLYTCICTYVCMSVWIKIIQINIKTRLCRKLFFPAHIIEKWFLSHIVGYISYYIILYIYAGAYLRHSRAERLTLLWQ